MSHNKQRLHKVKYFRALLENNKGVDESIKPLLRLSRKAIVRLQKTDYVLLSSLQRDPLLSERLKNLRPVDREHRAFVPPEDHSTAAA